MAYYGKWRTNHLTTKQIIELLLRHGADPRAQVVVEHRSAGTRSSTGRAADLHKKYPTEVLIYKSARAIIMEKYGEDEGKKLLSNAQNAQTQRNSILSSLLSWISWR